MKSPLKARTFLILMGWIAFAIVARLAPHPANISPMTTLAVFSGAVATQLFGRQAWLAWIAPLLAIFISDLFLGFYPSAPFVYLGFAAAIACGQWLRSDIASKSPVTYTRGALTATVAGSTVFFILSNLGVWLEGTMYPMTTSGFAACYFAAIPFFVKSLSGDLLSALVLFTVWASVRSTVSGWLVGRVTGAPVGEKING